MLSASGIMTGRPAIPHVVGVVAKIKMLGIDAGCIVASVQYGLLPDLSMMHEP